MTRILGADPGLSGALALYDTAKLSLEVVDTPILRLSRNGKAKNEIDLSELARVIDAWSPIDCAFVERVSAMPGQGVTSMFAFGRSTGIVLGVIAAYFIPISEVPPITWKRAVGIPKDAGKDASRAAIKALFPHQAGTFARVKDDGRAEAALIAIYGAKNIPTSIHRTAA